jgi:sugar (pentulose or hexulose) kinase
MPIAVLEDSVGAAVGDAYLAGMGAGLFKDIRQTLKTNVKIETRFVPDQKVHSYYQERYTRFRSLYESIKEEFDKSAPTASYKVK